MSDTTPTPDDFRRDLAADLESFVRQGITKAGWPAAIRRALHAENEGGELLRLLDACRRCRDEALRERDEALAELDDLKAVGAQLRRLLVEHEEEG